MLNFNLQWLAYRCKIVTFALFFCQSNPLLQCGYPQALVTYIMANNFISCGDINNKAFILSTLFVQASLPDITMFNDSDGDENS